MTLLRRSAVERHIKHLEAEVERLRYELDWTQANLKLMTEERDKAVAEVKRLRKERDHNELHGLEYKAEVERLREDRDKFAHEITRQDVEIARLHRIEEAARQHMALMDGLNIALRLEPSVDALRAALGEKP